MDIKILNFSQKRTQTNRNYYLKNKTIINQKRKEYYNKNKHLWREKYKNNSHLWRERYINNCEKRKQYAKQYYYKNRDIIINKKKQKYISKKKDKPIQKDKPIKLKEDKIKKLLEKSPLININYFVNNFCLLCNCYYEDLFKHRTKSKHKKNYKKYQLLDIQYTSIRQNK